MNGRPFALIAAYALATFLAGAAGAAPAARGLKFGPAPSWTEPLPSEGDSAGVEGDGIVELLLDRQMNPVEEALFVHYARKLTNASGVQRGSQLTFSWDPAYQTLTLHSVAVVREGRRIDALRRDQVKVIQREQEMDWHLFDGSLTAVLVLDDVRAGDVVEYAFTRGGYNPIFGGRYLDRLGVGASVPLSNVRFRLLWPRERHLFTKAHGDVPERQVTEKDGIVEYVWEAKRAPAVLAQSDLPSWFDAYPWVQLSEFDTWNDVARWAAPLYALDSPGAEVRAIAQRIDAAEASAGARTAAALRFVQDEVRYLGMEMGTGSYRPNPPATVLARRFGDCKDKALLLVAILRELDVPAWPALVNTEARQRLDAWHPSPAAFNHVIVRVELEEKELWLDPTRTQQGGALEEAKFPALRRALLVDPEATGLSRIPEGSLEGPETHVLETWTVPSLGGPASLVVTTTYRGPTADDRRANFAASQREVMEKGSLEFYTERYPEISLAAPIALKDDLAGNVFTVTESYTVPGLFAPRTNGPGVVAALYPQEVRDALPDPGSRKRTMPLGLRFPAHIVHETVVDLPEDWAVPRKKQSVATPFFRYTAEASSKGRVVTFRYEWQTLADAVPQAEAAGALASISKIVDDLGWELTHGGSAAAGLRGIANLNLPVVGVSVLFLGVCAAGAVKLARWRFRTPPDPAPETDAHLRGIGGWLVLVAIGLVVRPVILVAHLTTGYTAVFQADTWASLTSPGGASYHPIWSVVLLGEVLTNIGLLVFSILLLVLFFRMNRIFPKLAMAYFAIAVLTAGADAAVVPMLPTVTDEIVQDGSQELFRATIQALIWIPYLALSRRVHATFVS